MPDEPPRLFLSYGVRDASDVAERLHRDLTARGYKIWQDIERIRTGWAWDNELQDGLLTSKVVLALLSPHSVRRVRDVGNVSQVDSVYLDEIAYARGARKIPIVPVQVISCEAPFLIYRLHQIDFRHWRESEATYQAGLVQICASIEAALRGETPERPWRPLLEPWDFAPFLLEKRNHFTGRQWLFRDLDEWRSKQAPPALLITGEPGIGKSAIVAALVDNNPDGQVLAYHCCRADTPATLEPARFVRSLAGMLAARLEGYAAMLENPGIKDALERVDSDPASAFEAAVLSPMHSVPRTAGDRRYLLIDALDEALMHPKRPTIVDVLAARINRLPPWFGIVATTRREPDVLNQLRGLPAQALKADDPKNQDDVRVFLQRRLSEPGLRNKVEASGKMLEEVATGLLRSSAGNFLFVTTAIDAIEGGQLRFDDIDNQPPGHLSSLYEVFFNRLFRDAGIDFQPAGQVLEVVAAARESLTRKQIATVTGLDAEKELPPLLGRLAAFVPVREGRYSLFHRSLFEWLTGWDTQQDQSFAGHYHLSLQEGHKRLTDWGWAEYERGFQNASLYCFRHLVAHLHEADRNDRARTVLLDFDWLQAKLAATDVNALISDYDYLPEDKDLQLVQSAVRLSAHVLVRDQRQLASQLTGRLVDSSDTVIEALLTQTLEKAPRPWLRPIRANLSPPGGPLIRTLEGHTDRVSAVAVTPDGRCAVSASLDRTLRLWDLESGQMVRTLEGHTGSVHAVAVTPDGRRAASASSDRTLRLWDLESGQTLHTLEGHTDWVNAVAVTPDGLRAVSVSGDGTLRLWDLESGQTLRTLEGHTDWAKADRVTAMALTPDGRRVVWELWNETVRAGTVRVWDLESGQSVRTFEGYRAQVTAIVVAPDGRRAVSSLWDSTLRVWDLESGQSVQTLEGHTREVTAVAVMSDGRRAISASGDGTLRVWDLESGQSVQTLEGHTREVTAVAVMSDGRRAISASGDGTLQVWDLKSSQIVRPLEGHTQSVNALAITPEGRRAVSASSDHTLRVWDLESGQTMRILTGHTSWVLAVAITPEGRRAVSASHDRTLRVWDLESGQTMRILTGHTSWVLAVAITPDGRQAVSASRDHTLGVWDLESDRTRRTLSHSNRVSAVAITPDGRRAVSASWDHMLRVWDLGTGQIMRTLEGHTREVTAVALTPDGRRAISASGDGTLRVWDLKSGQSVHTLEGYGVSAVALTPEGRRVVSAGGKDCTLRLWDLETGQTLRTLEGHTKGVTAVVVVTADGRRAVSASNDQTVRLWDLESGEAIATFIGESDIESCAVAPDGRTTIAGDESGRVHFLQLIEADKTKPPIGDAKIRLLHRKEQAS